MKQYLKFWNFVYLFLIELWLKIWENHNFRSSWLMTSYTVQKAHFMLIIWIFNNWQINRNLILEAPTFWKWSSNLFKYDLTCFSIFHIFFYALLLSKSNVLKITTKFYAPIFLIYKTFLRILIWLCGREIILKPRTH